MLVMESCYPCDNLVDHAYGQHQHTNWIGGSNQQDVLLAESDAIWKANKDLLNRYQEFPKDLSEPEKVPHQIPATGQVHYRY